MSEFNLHWFLLRKKKPLQWLNLSVRNGERIFYILKKKIVETFFYKKMQGLKKS